jgi:uncharacterized protein YqeY
MSLETRVMDALKTAMKAKDEAALRTLRAIKAAILVEKTAEGFSGELNEAAELKMLQKLAKQRRDSLEIFSQQNREDLAATEREELAIIEQFLPQQMSAEELEAEIRRIIIETGATSPADMGKVMGAASKSLAGRADGKAISDMVKTQLAQG